MRRHYGIRYYLSQCVLRPRKAAAFGLLVLCCQGLAASAAWAQTTGTWSGNGTTNSWADPNNWDTIPGSTSGTTSLDTAYFNSVPSGFSTVGIDLGRNISNLTFDAGSGSYTIGGSGANGGNSLLLSSGGAATITSALTSTVSETFNAPLTLEPGSYSFANNSTNTATAFSFAGNITGGAGSATLNLGGTNTGSLGSSGSAFSGTANTISGNISNGTSGSVALNQTSGYWLLTGNNSYSGGTNVSGGTFAISTMNSAGTGNITLTNGATLQAFTGLGSNPGNLFNSNIVVPSGQTGTFTGTYLNGNDYWYGGTLSGGGTLTINSGDFLPYSSNVSSISTLDITGAGTRVLMFGPGNLTPFLGGNSGNMTVNVTNGADLDFGQTGYVGLANNQLESQTFTFASGTSMSQRAPRWKSAPAISAFPRPGR